MSADIPTPPVLLPVLRTVLVSGDDARFCHPACRALRFDHAVKDKSSPHHTHGVWMTWCEMFEEPLSGKTAPKRGPKCLAATEVIPTAELARKEEEIRILLRLHIAAEKHRWFIAQASFQEARWRAKGARGRYEERATTARGLEYGLHIAAYHEAWKTFRRIDRELLDCARWAS